MDPSGTDFPTDAKLMSTEQAAGSDTLSAGRLGDTQALCRFMYEVPSILELIITLCNILQLRHSFDITILDQTELTPGSKAQDGTGGLGCQTTPGMTEYRILTLRVSRLVPINFNYVIILIGNNGNGNATGMTCGNRSSRVRRGG